MHNTLQLLASLSTRTNHILHKHYGTVLWPTRCAPGITPPAVELRLRNPRIGHFHRGPYPLLISRRLKISYRLLVTRNRTTEAHAVKLPQPLFNTFSATHRTRTFWSKTAGMVASQGQNSEGRVHRDCPRPRDVRGTKRSSTFEALSRRHRLMAEVHQRMPL